ncbi:MAG: hypothetical protein K2Y05_11450 [Hyphomicrobiaceae bacterium]|nr:hypothetical protein [Hyphomicrobiaceae bacterium]
MIAGSLVTGLSGLVPWAGSPSFAQPATAEFQPKAEAPEDYPAGPGRDETFYACTSCHAFKLVAAQGMGRQQWDDTLVWMTERHKLPVIVETERDVILDYLAAQYGPKPTPGGRTWKNPFAE